MPAASAPRLASLDVFRGATIALMILVNNAGDWGKTYAPLLHAPWHGWTPTDLVFPFFLFIVGVAIPFALAPRLAARPPEAAVDRQPGSAVDPQPSPTPLYGKIVRRSAILFALGLFGAWFPFYTVVWERARLPGVLQRIAVVYLVAAFAYLHLSARARAGLGVALLASYWAAMMLVPVPGFGAGDLSPEGNLAFWLDHRLLGAHTWRYAPGPGDPEGILSTLPAIVSALAGIACGELLRAATAAPAARVRTMLAAGTIATAAGVALHRWFPINKNLWSPSYVVFTSGLAVLCLAALWWLVDQRRVVAWSKPFAIFGRNSILAFVGSGLLAKTLLTIKLDDGAGGTLTLQKWLYLRLYAAHLPDYVASLGWAVSMVLLWLAILWVLDWRRIYLRV